MKTVITRPNYRSHLTKPPLGMGYVCAYLKRHGKDAQVIDRLMDISDNHAIISRCDDADMVGIFCMSDYFSEAIDLSQRLKREGKIVVIGGPHGTVLPKETLQNSGADYVIVGEGEASFSELIETLESNRPIQVITPQNTQCEIGATWSFRVIYEVFPYTNPAS